MKNFMITLAIIVAAGIFLITSYSKIGRWVVADVASQEGSPDAMQAEAQKNVAEFAVRCTPFLDKRVMVARAAQILDEDYFVELATDSLDRYRNTPLQTSKDYEFLLVNQAVILDGRTQPADAYALYKEYQTLFPTGKDADMVRSAVNRLVLKYGYQ